MTYKFACVCTKCSESVMNEMQKKHRRNRTNIHPCTMRMRASNPYAYVNNTLHSMWMFVYTRAKYAYVKQLFFHINLQVILCGIATSKLRLKWMMTNKNRHVISLEINKITANEWSRTMLGMKSKKREKRARIVLILNMERFDWKSGKTKSEWNGKRKRTSAEMFVIIECCGRHHGTLKSKQLNKIISHPFSGYHRMAFEMRGKMLSALCKCRFCAYSSVRLPSMFPFQPFHFVWI